MTSEDQNCDGGQDKPRDIVSLILGILSLIFWLIPLFGFPVAITGLVFGITRRSIPGMVLNIIGLCLTVANSAVGIFYLSFTSQL